VDNGLMFGYAIIVVSSVVMLWAALAAVDASKTIKQNEEDRKISDEALLRELERLRKLLMGRRR
jgi:hypothetical protein